VTSSIFFSRKSTRRLHAVVFCSVSLLTNLEILDVSINTLSDSMSDDLFGSLVQLKELNISSCGLKFLPSRFV